MRWGRVNYADFPWRLTRNSFHALIAEVMLQRTRAEQVVPTYIAFSTRYLDPQTAASEDPADILKLLKPLGLKWRAKKILELIQELANRDGVIPSRYEELIKLPGIGPYAASAYLSLHVNIWASIIDANAVRLWSRIFGLRMDKETRRNKEFLYIAEKMTPKQDFKIFNYAVLDHTRTICKQKPLCNKCPANHYCNYYRLIQVREVSNTHLINA